MYLIITILLLCFVAAMVWASASISSRLYLRSHCRAEGEAKVCSITFDDGPDPVRTPQVLDVLAHQGVKATFFLIGQKAAAHPEIVRRMVAEGHTVGNHTYSHSGCFPLLGGRAVRQEIERTAQIIEQITGVRPRFFRPPFGVTNPIIGRAVRALRLSSIGWCIRSLDTIVRTPRTQVLNRILRRIHPGAIILLHDPCLGGAELLQAVIEQMKSRHYDIKTVDQLLELKPYED